MESEPLPENARTARRGVAMLVVLSMVVLLTMLGYMGMEMAGRDTLVSGTYLDINSRDQAVKSSLQLALARLQANPARTVAQLQAFVADSSKPLASARQYMNLAQSSCSLQVADPGFFALGTGSDQTGAKVQIVSVDIGSNTAGSTSGDGVRIVLRSTGRGRNGDDASAITSYHVTGVDVPASPTTAPPMNFAIYLNGTLSSTNFGNDITGNVYVSGDVSTNSAASVTVDGNLRVGGSFASNAAVVSKGNVVIGGDMSTNGSAPITANQNMVVKGGFSTMNAPVSVLENLEMGAPATANPWNSGATLTVGGQLWDKASCREIGAKISVGGSAFFDNCLTANPSAVATTIGNLYVARTGGGNKLTIKSGTWNISGNLGTWNAPNGMEIQSGSTVNVSGNLLLKGPLAHSGTLSITGASQFWGGISNIANTSATAITTTGALFLQGTAQKGDFSGGVTLGGPLTTKGTLDPNFSNAAAAASRWGFSAGATSKVWNYENTGAFASGNNPRVAGSTNTNGSGYRGVLGSIATPADLMAVPVPVAATAYASHPYTAQELDLSISQTWNQCPRVDTTVLKTVWSTLTDAMATTATASTNNWTAADLQKIYNTHKRADGWLVMRLNSSCSFSNMNPPGGTFSGKAIWIVEKSINVNGNWPSSATSSDIQMVYVRGAGFVGAFGTPGDMAGYVHYEAPFTGQMLWGNGTANTTLTGAIHIRGAASSFTGNGGNRLKVVGSQTVLDEIQKAFPGVLIAPTTAYGTPLTTGSTKTLVLREPHFLFRRIGEYR